MDSPATKGQSSFFLGGEGGTGEGERKKMKGKLRSAAVLLCLVGHET